MFGKEGNHEKYDHCLTIISIASCSMNCLALWSRLFIHVNFEIMERLMITVYTITSTIKNMDFPSRKLWHVGHGTSQIIISANIDTAKTVGKVIPELNGSFTGTVFCVFIPMSSINLTYTLKKDDTYGDIKKVLNQALDGPLKDILAYAEDQVVSCEFNSDTYSSSFDVWTSIALNDNVVKLIYLYENKFDYRNYIMDFMVHMAYKD
ncbi:glyceraldehyde-3-phosphate dehydrogenase-like [Panthera tigris]|uniref:glyceraldehyde-3-phosphate dehydrogenase-like n=1 Tax=Panthera tigris TaxID=9694 RepID=UPI00076631D0|nr:glyceraldehyde-3-phosphate dehydrogenase-like [Panthera tigris]XP_049499237.1 glyceraldehyde-3-phosphate dehydrogenase-like [Panthera uncia]